jgi:glycogen debranching enzyme
MRITGLLRQRELVLGSLFTLLIAVNIRSAGAQELELVRSARPWEFFSATGSRAGLFGDEAGNLEAWVYPLKILRNFRLRFLVENRALPAESLVRTISVRPGASSILYSGDSFSVKETLFVPVQERGAVIVFEVETAHPLEIEARFEGDFQLMWPAALGGTYLNWEPPLHAFYFGEEQKKYAALLGSPAAELADLEYQTNYSASPDSGFRLGAIPRGKDTRVVVFAAAVNGRAEAEIVYRRLLSDYASLEKQSASYYRDYLARTVGVDLPDGELERAYDWARISVLQGLVTNPYLGTGLIAGYRTSGTSQRPGFAWFFGRDSFWTDFALDAEGDFPTTRTALDFISKFQRADGKMPHEISQGANFVNWFKDFPYAYASADATPLYIIALNDYVKESGDRAFAEEKWESAIKAYQFLRSTYDSAGLPQNFGFGHGWVEGGPLLPVKTELYQSGVGAEALRSLSSLARLAGKDNVGPQLEDEFRKRKQLINQVFWSPESSSYAFALDQNNQKIIEPSVLATVPMWFELLDQDKAAQMLVELAGPDHETDWGMRIISSRASRYDPGGYHYGSVWPLFTGWASVGEYRYHRPLPAYANLRSNALLALDGSLGHVTEVLSGDYYQPLSTSSPHQIWSAAMVISPLLRGLLGIETDASEPRVTLRPHLPADWSWFRVHRVRAGDAVLDFSFQRTPDRIILDVDSSRNSNLEFSPALSPRAEVIAAEKNREQVPFKTDTSEFDQHATVRVPLAKGRSTLSIRLRNDFAVSYRNSLPPLGSRSRELRAISESWSASRDALTMEFAGASGARYELALWNPGEVRGVEGGELKEGKLLIQMPAGGSESVPHKKITIHFANQVRRRQ